MDLDDNSRRPVAVGATRTAKKKPFQADDGARGKVKKAAPGGRAPSSALEGADQESGGQRRQARMDMDEEDVSTDQQAADIDVASGGGDGHVSCDGEGATPGGDDGERDGSPRPESPSEKENRRRSPRGKSGGKSGSKGLEASWKGRKTSDRGSLQQVVDRKAS